MRLTMRRRLIPPALAIVAGGSAAIASRWTDEGAWLRYTLLTLAALFAFKAALFGAMRYTMVDQLRRLTVFGYALVDFFAAVVLGDLTLVVLFGSAWLTLESGRGDLPYWAKVTDRSLVIGGTVFVMATGVAVAYEMRQARGRVRVHEDEGGEPWHS